MVMPPHLLKGLLPWSPMATLRASELLNDALCTSEEDGRITAG
jgi:hypothetical protein